MLSSDVTASKGDDDDDYNGPWKQRNKPYMKDTRLIVFLREKKNYFGIGTVLSKHHVLTSETCFTLSKNKDPSYKGYFADSEKKSRLLGKTYTFKSVITPRQCNPSISDIDVSLITVSIYIQH